MRARQSSFGHARLRPKPEPAVVDWFSVRSLLEMATATINLAEIRCGLARLPFGRPRRDLEVTFNSLAARGFANRVFDFDAAAAEAYGDFRIGRSRQGAATRRCGVARAVSGRDPTVRR
jgi:predicted nucleic acid-binding protein